MKQKKVFLMSGPPGCGKSTYVRNHLTDDAIWISRDNIRFSVIKEDEEYFSHEDEVFDIFINSINEALENDEINSIYVDATHLTKRARDKVVFRLNNKNIGELNCICFRLPRQLVLERNGQREGRALVPKTVVNNMFDSYIFPKKKTEKFDHVYVIDQYNEMEEI